MVPVSRMSSPPNGRMTRRKAASRQPLATMSERMTECVSEWPLTALCTAFGGGLVAGVGLVALFHQMQPQPTTAESLMHRISDTVRNALSQHLSAFHS
jgi:hypothetical protein